MQQLSFLDDDNRSAEQMNSSWHDEILSTFGVARTCNWIDEFGSALRRWSRTHSRGIRTLSLFTGGGGLDIGFHDAGFEIVHMIEIEKRYVETLRRNSQRGKLLSGSKPECMDVRDYYPEKGCEVDFVIGGPPCQTFSAAGRRAAGVLGTDDPRGTLFEEYVRILETLQPQGFLFENVYGITGAQGGEAWREIKEAFEKAGYSIHFRILDTADYGVPQHRERLFIVGRREGDFLFPRPTHGGDAVGAENHFSAHEALEDIVVTDARIGIGGENGHLLNDIPPGLNYSFYTQKLGHPNPVFGWRSKFSDYLYKADPERPVRTIKAQGGQYTGPFSWHNRPFTVAELKRLQTFPDDYELAGNRQTCIEQIGNSVPPQAARMLALSILDQVFLTDMPVSMHYLASEEQLGFRKRKRLLTQAYREKARTAIERLYSKEKKPAKRYREIGRNDRYLSSDFHMSDRRSRDSVKRSVQFDTDDERWIISASLPDMSQSSFVYEIFVTPAVSQNWLLPTQKITLRACDLSESTFTILWKSFEERVKSATSVADLVQLRGYYQYGPKMVSEMVLHRDGSPRCHWMALRKIVNGVGVGQHIHEEKLGSLLQLASNEVFAFLQWLRNLGYEVRNQNTNPQISEGDVLIPYSFPTLTPRSVQLHKSLGGRNG